MFKLPDRLAAVFSFHTKMLAVMGNNGIDITLGANRETVGEIANLTPE